MQAKFIRDLECTYSANKSQLSRSKLHCRAPSEQGGSLLYRCKAGEAGASAIRGDAEEKVVFKIIEEAGNKGTWIRDIRVKSNLAQAQLTKVLKSLRQVKAI